MKRKCPEMSCNIKGERSEKKMKNSYSVDPRLLPRVRQYIEAHRGKKVIDVSSMADDLQGKFGEYGRKKKAAFRKSVERVYEHILQAERGDSKKRGNDKDACNSGDDSSASFSDDNREYTTYEDTNAMNSLMRNFYMKPCSRPGSRPPSRPSSGTSTPVGGRSPFRPSSDPDTGGGGNLPTPLFTVDRTGDKLLKEGAVKPKPKTPVASPKPKLKLSSTPKTSSVAGHAKPQSGHEVTLGTVEEVSTVVKCAIVPRAATSVSDVDTPLESSLDQGPDPSTSLPASNISGELDPNDKVNKEGTGSARPASKKRRRQEAQGAAGDDPSKKKRALEVTHSSVTFADIGGNDKMLADVCRLLVHMKHPEVYRRLGVTPPRGFLLHGPPGCGKTLLAHAIAGELELPFLKIAATEIVSGVSGESEEKVRDVFDKAVASAPCVLFIDEIDAITQKRENASKDMERRIVSQLLTCMDELNNSQAAHVLVIGATNRPDSLDPALRRAGRFDREISLGIPDSGARERILTVLCRELRLAPDLDLADLARLTPGFVGADLMALAREAAISAVNRIFRSLQKAKPDREQDVKTTPQEASSEPSGHGESPEVPEDGAIKARDKNTGETPRDMLPDTAESNLLALDTTMSQSSCSTDEPKADLTGGGELGVSCAAADSTVAPMETDLPLETATQTNESARPLAAGETVAPCGDRDDEGGADRPGHTFISSLQQAVKKDHKPDDDLGTVLSWLKEHPPLTDDQLQDLWIEMSDFQVALRSVQPSAKREGFATIPDVTWSDIGALQDVREELQMAILAPVRHPEQFRALGLTSPPGILLAGPPGCGKTLLAKAVANESGINFISVKGPELLNMYVGESERAVRQVFQRARNSSPCVIFFDELDALCPRRASGGEGGSSVRVVNQLLTEMDGLEERKQVFIMGATNRPDIIDPAILRPGRLDKTLYVGLPTVADRHDILRTLTKNGTKPCLTEDVDLAGIAKSSACDGFTGADLAALVREASVTALRELMARPSREGSHQPTVSQRHFNAALRKVRPSVTEKDKQKYETMRHRIQPTQ